MHLVKEGEAAAGDAASLHRIEQQLLGLRDALDSTFLISILGYLDTG